MVEPVYSAVMSACHGGPGHSFSSDRYNCRYRLARQALHRKFRVVGLAGMDDTEAQVRQLA
ncbi:MAG: hypothetical protein ACRYF6_23975, partial [Janthinobacterium lividum]